MVTILFADIVGYSTLSEVSDPEDLLDIMSQAYPCLLEPIHDHAGTVVQVRGDGVLAYFGVPFAQEDDPERAILAGLDIIARIQAYAKQLDHERNLSAFGVRVGINTGLVVVGEMYQGKTLEYTALGDAVNLAARLQQNAPPDSMLISHPTYSLVSGIFDVLPQAPMRVKGRQKYEHTYLVQNIKPAHLRTYRRGVEGIVTPMVGREPEMAALQNCYQDAIQGGETRLVLISGEVGIGKTRLMDEFAAWVALQPVSPVILHGRAGVNTQTSPFSIFRNVFARSFEILENDSSTQALEKFRLGTKDVLEAEQADLVGQLVGFDFSGSPTVLRLLGNPSFTVIARLYLLNYLRALAVKPLLVLLEDLHWMDDSSLDLITELVSSLGKEKQSQLMIVCTARIRFFERRAKWGEGIAGFTRLELSQLSRIRSRSLIAEILRKVESIPEILMECVLDEAEGSPFFIEELLKMLIDEGVIETQHDNWQVRLDKLAAIHVPSTLTGILQARLDSLPLAERLVLQRAAVVGRTFWDGIVRALTAEDGEIQDVSAHLASLRQRGLVFHREHSSILGSQEYLFKHALLRDVAYETVLLKHRRLYHNQVARWIEVYADERLEEHLALVAAHYADSGQSDLAAEWYTRAGERAISLYSMQEAHTWFGHALKHIDLNDLQRHWRALIGHDEAAGALGLVAERHADDSALLNLACLLEDDSRLAVAYYRIGCQAYAEGNNPDSLRAFQQALEAARREADLPMQGLILPMLVFIFTTEGDLGSAAALVDQALDTAAHTGDNNILARALTNLAPYYQAIGDIAQSVQLLQQQVEINHQQGNRLGESLGLINLGYYLLSLGQFETGHNLLERAVQSADSIDARRCVAYGLLNLGLADWRLGQLEAAGEVLQRSLNVLQSLEDQRGLVARQFYLGLVLESAGSFPAAAAQFEAARDAFKSLGMSAQVNEAQAGLARIALQCNELHHAEMLATQLVAFMQQDGAQGFEFPILVYLTCARIFQALGESSHFQQILEKGIQELYATADRISDTHWRDIFLHTVPENHTLIDLASAQGQSI